MASIVAVHGIGQQFKGDQIIHCEWWPALLSGLHLAKHHLDDKREMVCPFYGHLFRPSGTLAGSVEYEAEDVKEDEDDAKLLKLLWDAAAEAEPDNVPSQTEFGNNKSLGWPQFVQRGLYALSRSSFFANIAENLLIGDLKQVVRYLNDWDLRQKILKIVLDCITEDTKVVIGHSLGSVVAYEALCSQPNKVVSFVSLGSPLGIRNLIFDQLKPPPNAMGIGAWPGKVEHWTNIADKGDIVALQKQLAVCFSDEVKDVLVSNGSDAHHGERYLTTREAGEAIGLGLWPKSS